MTSVRRSNLITWWGARFALLALALQFGLSLGHVHDVRGDDDRASIVVAARLSAQATEHVDPGAALDYCDICASIAALATGSIPAAPVLSVPAAPAIRLGRPLPAFLLTGTAHLLARPRGPPGTTTV